MPRERGWLAWNVFAGMVAMIVLAWPALTPLVELLGQPRGWLVWTELDRLLPIVGITLLVMTGSVLLALILGASAAFLLTRTGLPGRNVFGWMLLFSLLVPMPLLTSGWYLFFQQFHWPIPALWPLPYRLLGVILLHGLLAMPWVTLIVGLGLIWVEPELEEEARLSGGFSQVFRHVLLPRCKPFVGLAIVAATWPTWQEIAATDYFKVQTLAEEVYVQLTAGGGDDGPRITALALPFSLLALLILWRSIRLWRQNCPPRWPSLSRLHRFRLGRLTPWAMFWMLLVVSLISLVPLFGLIVKAGTAQGQGQSSNWSIRAFVDNLARVAQSESTVLYQSAVLVALTALAVALLGLLLIWLGRRSQAFDQFSWILAAVLWSIPGPLLGLGLLAVIQQLLQFPGRELWSQLLYDTPSPLPNLWANVLRYWPLAWMSLWPLARMLPREWDDLAHLEGAGPWRRLWRIDLPALLRPVCWVSVAVGILSLGEISAGKLVATPGYLPLSHLVFQQLHAGADVEVAALALLLMLLSMAGGLLVLLLRPWRSRKS